MSDNIQIVLPTPHDGQLDFLESEVKFRVLMCGRRWGKSLVCQILSTHTILDNKKVAYVTPTYKLAKVFYDSMLALLPQPIIKASNKTDLVIELVTGGIIRFMTGEEPDNFRGLAFHLVIIDEAAYVKDLKNSWQKAIMPTLTDYDGQAVFISTPKGKDYFNTLFNKGNDPLEQDWQSFRFTSYDNPYLPPEMIQLAKEELTGDAFNQEYLAIPSENAKNPFKKDVISQCKIAKLSTLPTVVYGIDLAKSSDYTVIIGMDKVGHMTYYDRFQLNWEATKNKIRALDPKVLKHIDSTGVGDPIVEELIKENRNVRGFKITVSSKSQLILSLIKSFEEGKVGYIEAIEDELEVFEYSTTSTGYVKYEAMTGCHDDKVIALALANLIIKQKYPNVKKSWSVVTASLGADIPR